ncbi:AGE family epimerase/isomerase [Acetobacter syzygii]|uniref:Mannose-6-phosphate isomerase n=1 Tax=Acetobacter syzygii TaxID=146476 RepID=A0A270BM68_9PROT|nr:AGE family epimerase/isomerase [Acetobacter syzygii]PAL25751.1 mannose-6-phosphate isomerase [Acetobacter syzygii]PAL25862.1 mannose-6-phosphate isomerase [Acetobacter syzygii]GEL55603.1 mannose-6-phosphate isomerase [Acetobacter syzygii]
MWVHDVALWKNWMVGQALPLWSHAGYDSTRHFYYERLTFDAAPIAVPHLRLMVQARQIATFCMAEHDGLFHAADHALTCLSEVTKRYWRADGQPGWVFAIGADGSPSNGVRDLYAHAFILFAHAWAYRLSGEEALRVVAKQTVEELEKLFAAPVGGFWDAVPLPDAIRRQNPHMHLLEAYLALFEVTADQFYLNRAQALVALALEYFVRPESGLLLEFFNADWQPCKNLGHNPVEPGHLFEWSWLFNTYIMLYPTDPQKERIQAVAERLYQLGQRYGLKQNGVCDGILDDGTLSHASTRIWPQTELVRLLACRQKRALGNGAEAGVFKTLTHIFFTHFAPEHLHGGWIDRRAENGQLAVDHMPASSLYHIYGAVRESVSLL